MKSRPPGRELTFDELAASCSLTPDELAALLTLTIEDVRGANLVAVPTKRTLSTSPAAIRMRRYRARRRKGRPTITDPSH